MRISIIIPVFNVAPYIKRCLKSIEAQTYHDIECILIDDCCTDESMQVVNQFVSDYNGNIQFIIICNQQNQGPSASRNSGIMASTGDYILFIDSDDAITPDCIEILTSLAQKYPDADYVQGDIITGTDQLMEGAIDPDVPEFCNDKELLEKIILCKTHRTAWNKLMKRSFLIDNSLLFPIGILMEDHYWIYYVSKHAHAVAFTHKGTYFYYNNNGSIVNSPLKTAQIKRYSSYIYVIEAIINDMLQRHDIQPYHRTYVAEALVFCMINLTGLNSIYHWMIFWRFIWHLAWKVRAKITCKQLFFFICMQPPLCFMIGIKGWRWRFRKYVANKL